MSVENCQRLCGEGRESKRRREWGAQVISTVRGRPGMVWVGGFIWGNMNGQRGTWKSRREQG